MSAFLNDIIRVGQNEHMPAELSRNIQLINGLSLIAIITTPVSMSITILEVRGLQLVLALSIMSLSAGVIYLNYRGFTMVAVHIFLWLALLAVGLGAIMNAYHTFIFLYLMPISLIPSMLFKNYYRYVYFGLSILLLVLINFFHQNFTPITIQSENFIQIQQYASLILSNFAGFYLLIFFKKSNVEYEQRMEKDRFYTHDLLIKTQNVNQELQNLNLKLQKSEDESRQKTINLSEINQELQSLNTKLQDHGTEFVIHLPVHQVDTEQILAR